jgi:hypothetical protein
MYDSIVYLFASLYSKLSKIYSDIAMMNEDNYDADKVFEVLRVINNIEYYSKDEQKELLTFIYKILKTTAGRRFFSPYSFKKVEEFIESSLLLYKIVKKFKKTEEFMKTVWESSSEIDNELDRSIAMFFVNKEEDDKEEDEFNTEVLKAISVFFVKNDDGHDIDYPLYEDIYISSLKEDMSESD